MFKPLLYKSSYVVSKIFKMLANERPVDQLTDCYLFSNFHYDFKPGCLTAAYMSGGTRAITFDISHAIDRVFLSNLSLIEFLVRFPSLLVLPS